MVPFATLNFAFLLLSWCWALTSRMILQTPKMETPFSALIESLRRAPTLEFLTVFEVMQISAR